MDYKEIIQTIKPEMEKVMNFFESELAKIRTNRASPSLVENIICECFGERFPLKQLAAISTPEPRQIVIQPWDKSYFEGIQKALSTQLGMGLSPVADRDVIRINLPPLSEEYRKSLTKVISEKQEEARRSIRRWREECWRQIQERAKEGEIREDDKFKAKEELQKIIDDYQKKIEGEGEKKKKEITE